MNQTNLLSQSIAFATNAHKTQEDKNHEDYITHPLRVMDKMETTKEKIVAILHDVLEDCPGTQEELRELIQDDEIWDALVAITRKEEKKDGKIVREVYKDYILRVKTNPLATKVKLADLEDNLSRDGASDSLCKRYEEAIRVLTT